MCQILLLTDDPVRQAVGGAGDDAGDADGCRSFCGRLVIPAAKREKISEFMKLLFSN